MALFFLIYISIQCNCAWLVVFVTWQIAHSDWLLIKSSHLLTTLKHLKRYSVYLIYLESVSLAHCITAIFIFLKWLNVNEKIDLKDSSLDILCRRTWRIPSKRSFSLRKISRSRFFWTVFHFGHLLRYWELLKLRML